MVVFRFLFALCLLAAAGGAVAADALEGKALALDGDTIRIDRTKIRLWGVAAPEMTEIPWGPRARAELDIWLAQPVRCVPTGSRSHGRVVARCFVMVSDGGPEVDIGEKMIRSGLAVEYRVYSDGAYEAAENFARFNRMGIWAVR